MSMSSPTSTSRFTRGLVTFLRGGALRPAEPPVRRSRKAAEPTFLDRMYPLGEGPVVRAARSWAGWTALASVLGCGHIGHDAGVEGREPQLVSIHPSHDDLRDPESLAPAH